MVRTGTRLLRKRAGAGKREQCPFCLVLLTEDSHTISPQRRLGERGCCDPTRAPLTSPGQREGSPSTRHREKGVSGVAGGMMLEGAKGPLALGPPLSS